MLDVGSNHSLLSTKNSINELLCQGEGCRERSFVLFSRSHTPRASGAVGSGLVFLLTLEAIHPFTDFRGHFYCISVGGGFRRKKNKGKPLIYFLQRDRFFFFFLSQIFATQTLRSLLHTSKCTSSCWLAFKGLNISLTLQNLILDIFLTFFLTLWMMYIAIPNS